jgi:protein-S-isoprenylcysteine O-methyltransferase Ste14
VEWPGDEFRNQDAMMRPNIDRFAIAISLFSLKRGSRIVSNLMRATRFEFERRFWIIFCIYAVGFWLAYFDHVSFITGLRHLLAPSIVQGSPEAENFKRAIIALGAVLVFLTAALRTWGAAYLRTDVVHDSAQHSEALVADGPFRYTRNPLYLANVPMAAGIGVMASRLGWLFLVVASWIFVYRLIFREEEALQQSQGESYRAYLKAVPRFWPALISRVPSGGRPPQWGQAFVGESFIWFFGVAELCLAVTLNTKLTTIIFIVGFVAHFIVLRRIRGRKSEDPDAK